MRKASLIGVLTGLVVTLPLAGLQPVRADDMMQSTAPVIGSNPRPDGAFKMPAIKEDPNPLMVEGPAGEIFTFARTGKSTCGRYLWAKALVPPGGGPIPHVHHWTDEYFYFPDGGFTLFMGTQLYPSVNVEPGTNGPKDHLSLITTKPNDLFYGPRYIIHGFINNSSKPHYLYFFWLPDLPTTSILTYFSTLGQVVKDPANPPPIDPVSKIRFVTEAPRWGINQSHDFFQYVADTDFDGRVMTATAAQRKAFLDMIQEAGDGTKCPKPDVPGK